MTRVPPTFFKWKQIFPKVLKYLCLVEPASEKGKVLKGWRHTVVCCGQTLGQCFPLKQTVFDSCILLLSNNNNHTYVTCGLYSSKSVLRLSNSPRWKNKLLYSMPNKHFQKKLSFSGDLFTTCAIAVSITVYCITETNNDKNQANNE